MKHQSYLISNPNTPSLSSTDTGHASETFVHMPHTETAAPSRRLSRHADESPLTQAARDGSSRKAGCCFCTT